MTVLEQLKELEAQVKDKKWFATHNPKWGNGRWRIDTKPDTPYENFGQLAYMTGENNTRLAVTLRNLAPDLIAVVEAARVASENGWAHLEDLAAIEDALKPFDKEVQE